MRRIVVLGIAALLAGVVVEAASAVVPAKKIWSADRQVLIEVPKGALAKNVKITIRVLKRSKWPKELKRNAEDVEGKVYEFLPHGLRFRKPVTVIRWFKGFAEAEGLPELILARRSGRAKWTQLANETIAFEGQRVRVTGKTRRFSTFVMLDGGGRVGLVPPSVVEAVGGEFEASVVTDFKGRPSTLADASWGEGEGAVSLSGEHFDDEVGALGEYECSHAGPGKYWVDVKISVSGLDVAVLQMVLTGFERQGPLISEYTLDGSALCVGLALSSLTVNPLEVIGGQSAQGTVTLDAPAPATVIVFLEAGPGVTVPEFVAVPAGATSATFPIGTSEVSDVTHVPITARYNGVEKSELLTLLPPPSCSAGPDVSLTTVTFPEGGTFPGVQVTGQCDEYLAAGFHHVRFNAPTGKDIDGFAAHTTGCEPAFEDFPTDYLSCDVKPDGRICQIAILLSPEAEAGDTVGVRLEKADGTALEEHTFNLPSTAQPSCDWGGG